MNMVLHVLCVRSEIGLRRVLMYISITQQSSAVILGVRKLIILAFFLDQLMFHV